jgi:two-component system NtrC family sensor kinase
MDHPLSSTLQSHLTRFGRELPGASGPDAILDLLLAHVRAAWAPRELAARWETANGTAVRSHWPHPPRNHDAVLSLTADRGTVLDDTGPWLVVPLLGTDPSAGALAIRGGPGAFTEADLAPLGAFATLAGLALERLPDQAEPGDSPWQPALDLIAPALCIIDGFGSIRRANQGLANLLGGRRDDLIGCSWRSAVPADWAREVDRLIGGEDPDPPADLKLGDRVYAPSAARFDDQDESLLVLLFTDQTARSRFQEQLVQAEKMSAIGQLIAGVAHDLNNPLASVVGFAEFLSERPEVPATLREPVTIIREEAERASGIVKNLLSFVRKQEGQRRPTALPPILDATLALLRNEFLATGVEPRLEIEPDLPLPLVDPSQIQQVFVNLIHNAIQAIAATGRPGTVVLRARRWRDGVALDVIDDGPGMPEALAAHAFEPFFTTKPEGKGTGLGLSISQGIVTEHGGRITLETVEDRGSAFTVYLPAGDEASPAAAASSPGPGATGLRILVVDDEPHILHYMRATLESWGHTVADAADGEEAQARMAQDCFDLVVADLRMPRLGGRELYEALRRDQPALAERVVFATGDTVRGDTLAFLKSVGRPYLHKPFSLSELRALLAGVSKASDA